MGRPSFIYLPTHGTHTPPAIKHFPRTNNFQRNMHIRQFLSNAFKPDKGLWLTPLIGLCGFFSGWQPISLLNFMWLPLWILLTLHSNALSFILAWLFSTLGFWGSMTGSFSWIVESSGPYFTPDSLGLTFLLGLMVSSATAIVLIINTIVVKSTQTWNSALWFRICFCPLLATAFYMLLAKYGPFGEGGSPSEEAYAWKDVVVGSLYLGGNSLTNLVVTGLMALVVFFIEKYWFDLVEVPQLAETTETALPETSKPVVVKVAIAQEAAGVEGGSSGPDNNTVSVSVETKSSNVASKLFGMFSHPISVPLALLAITMITGSILNNYLPTAFYQKQVFSTHPTETWQFGCMAVQTQTDEFFLSEAAKMVSQGTKFITTSEVGLEGIVTLANESAWLVKFQDFARINSAYLGLGYFVGLDDSLTTNYNRYTIIDYQGQIVLKYDKTRPVPFSEDQYVTPGTTGPLAFEIDVNKIANLSTPQRPLRFVIATCWDGEFPDLIRQGALAASTLHGETYPVDYFLHPTWLWGSVSNFVNQVYPYRAIDNGMTELRCASGGNSGAYGSHGQAYLDRFTDRNTVLTMDVPLVRGTGSLFLLMGDVVGWACLAVAAFLIVYVVVGNKAPFGETLRDFKVWGKIRRY